MTNFITTTSKFLGRLDALRDAIKHKIADQFGLKDPICIMPYRGYGTPEQLYLKGRVLQDEGIKIREENAPVWKNLLNMHRRFESDEIPAARLEVWFDNQQQEVVANREGYFEVDLKLQKQLQEDSHGDRLPNRHLWEEVHLKLLDPQPDPSNPVNATGEVMIVTDCAQFGVISDIDDTIMPTAATDLLKMIRIAYLGNEHTRHPFPGVPEFYHALQKGQKGDEGNPIFYVSSSAWNMYDLFVKFMDCSDVPAGPILLRDIELSPDNLLSFEHEEHKMEQIQPILQRFPELPFILIGDTGQKDAEIYHQIVQENPDRVLGIYLRNVTPEKKKRLQEVEAIAQAVRQLNREFIVFSDTQTAIEHATQQGWITG